MTGHDRRRVRPHSDVTLQQLDGEDWGDPPPDATYLIRTCHRLRRQPLELFDAEDLRIMIGQRLSLPVLIPLALDVLERDPAAGGDMYEGALLDAVQAAAETRADDPAWAERLRAIIERVSIEPV
ncbi:MAG TPA: contact-dependent growth inhibition system immunity protein [Micropruina sp.]|nr:contact-dependent growth inhibition system immunity protein [Micropruina sp.]